MWLLRLGLYELTCAKEVGDDWVWLVDHTVQLDSHKGMIVVGLRLSAWQQSPRPLEHKDLRLLYLEPTEHSNGDKVKEQLEKVVAQTGVPREIVSDGGSDLKRGIELFRQAHPEIAPIYDVKHKMALLLKKELEADKEWEKYVSQANLARRGARIPGTQYLIVGRIYAILPQFVLCPRNCPLGENPELTAEDRAKFGPEPDTATWKKLELHCPKRDGSWADVTMVQPPSWLAEQHVRVGGTVDISVPECGIEGHAQVLSIGACPSVKRGQGHVVTATFRHHAVSTVHLRIEGSTEPIRCTGNHPFWSEDRRQFVRADALKIGEHLSSLHGPATLVSRTDQPNPKPVFNIQVQGTHVYLVGADGVLVHNGGICQTMSEEEAIENGLGIRDSQWPSRGLHEIEDHHPLMQGPEYRDFWTQRGLSNNFVENWVESLDTDVHQAIHNSGWWESELTGRITAQEAAQTESSDAGTSAPRGIRTS